MDKTSNDSTSVILTDAPWLSPVWLLRLSLLLSSMVALAGAVVLYGWCAHVDLLTRAGEGLPATHPLTATTLVLLGLACVARGACVAAADSLCVACAAHRACLALSLACLVVAVWQCLGYGHIAAVSADYWLFPSWTASAGDNPSRMSLPTTVMLLLTASALLTGGRHGGWLREFNKSVLLFALGVSLTTLLGHLFHAELFYGYFTSQYTAVLFGVLAVSQCLLVPVTGNWLNSQNSASTTLSRRLFLGLAIVPGALATTHLMVSQFFHIDPGSLSLIYVVTATLVGLVCITALLRQMDRLESETQVLGGKLNELKGLNLLTTDKIRGIVETAVDAIVTISREGAIESFNPAAVKMFGYSEEEVLGKNIKLLMPEPYRSEHDGYLQAYRPTDHTSVVGVGRDIVAQRKDGSTFPIELSVTQLGSPVPIGFTGTLRDISDRKRAEEQMQKMNDALRQSNAELEQFAYIASHDLQEPLRKISSYCALLRDEQGDALDDEGRDYLDVAIKSAKRLSTLVRDLLAFSRLSTKGQPLEPIRADACLRAALENLELAIEDSEALVTSERLPCVLADGSQLIQLFQNLIGNAIKYRGDQPPRVEVASRDLGEMVEFRVQDNGIGIDPQYAERIFQIFQRLHNRREYSGTGIGLACCKRIVGRLGGEVWVESSPGSGSTFFFTARKAQAEDTTTHEHHLWTDPIPATSGSAVGG